MSGQNPSGLLEQMAQELARALEKLERYEQDARRGQGQVNEDIYAELRGEIWNARATLRRLRGQGPGAQGDDVEQIRRHAQEQAIAELARRRGWCWEDSAQRWRTPEGNFYTRIGEPLPE